MKLWHCSQGENSGYDTHDSMVVAAETEQAAREMSPSGFYRWHDNAWWFQYADGTEKREGSHGTWADPRNVDVEYLGEAKEGIEAGVICASFNAG